MVNTRESAVSTPALRNLRVRPVYERPRVPEPMIIPLGMISTAAMGGLGWVCRRLLNLIPPDAYADDRGQLLYYLAPLFLLAPAVWVFSRLIGNKGIVRQQWVAIALAVIWSAAFTAALQYPSFRIWSACCRAEIPIPWVQIAILVGQFVLFIICCASILKNYTQRVYYVRPTTAAAKESFAFFTPKCGEAVLSALESGDGFALEALRTSGPVSTRHPESCTILVLSRHPHAGSEPAYLYVKEVSMTNALHARKPRGCLGRVWLNDARLEAADIDALNSLLPGLVEKQLGYDAPTLRTSGKAHTVGLPAGTPSALEAPGGSSLRVLPEREWRNMRLRYVLVSLCLWAGLLSPLPLSLIGVLYGDANRGSALRTFVQSLGVDPATITAAYAVIFGVLITTGLTVAFSQMSLVRRLVLRAVRSRTNLPYPVDAQAIVVGIEDARTYNKLKVLSEDFGVIRAMPGELYIDLGKSRGRITPEDLRFEVQQGVTGNSLRLVCRFGDYVWAFTAYDINVKRGLAAYGDPFARALRLRERIYDGMNIPESARPPVA